MFHGSPDCAAFPVLKQGMAGCVKEICKESPRSYLAAGVLGLESQTKKGLYLFKK